MNINEISEKKEQINQTYNQINDLNKRVNSNPNITGAYADFYKKQVEKVSTNIEELNNMMSAASVVEKKAKDLLQLKGEIEFNIGKISELSAKIEFLQNDVNNQLEIESLQSQINLLNEENIHKKLEYDSTVNTIKSIISQY